MNIDKKKFLLRIIWTEKRQIYIKRMMDGKIKLGTGLFLLFNISKNQKLLSITINSFYKKL